MAIGGVKDLVQRCRAALLANLGLKLVALVIAVISYVLIHRAPAAPPAAEPPACPP